MQILIRLGGVYTAPLSGSLLPVVMVIRGFGQDYEIFYLVASVLLGRPCSGLPVPLAASPLVQFKDTRIAIVTFTCTKIQTRVLHIQTHGANSVKRDNIKEDRVYSVGSDASEQEDECFHPCCSIMIQIWKLLLRLNTQQ